MVSAGRERDAAWPRYIAPSAEMTLKGRGSRPDVKEFIMHNILKQTLAAGAITALALGASVLPADAMQKTASDAGAVMQTQPSPSLIVFNQKPRGSEIDVTYAYLPKAGFITVYVSKDGVAQGNPVGVAALPAGANNNVKVKLSADVAAGAKLLVSLAEGSGKTFDAKSDTPAWPLDAIPASNHLEIL